MLSSLYEALRAWLAPEARWRRPDPVFRDLVGELWFLFAVPIYGSNRSDCRDLARFYASLPTSATFIVLRTVEGAAVRCSAASRPDSDAQVIALKTLDRIFTEEGAGALLEICDMYRRLKPEDPEGLQFAARVLAVATVHVADAVRQLPDYDALVSLGRTLSERDPAIAAQPEAARVWIAKHWQFCGGQVHEHFGTWYKADRLSSATRASMKKLGL